jgi:hypothetical protein
MNSTPTAKADGTVLTGVSETALLTLQVRAREARRPDSIIDDPMAIQLVDSIDFDFAKFGFTRRQDIAMRALAFDRHARRYLANHPMATVVALAEGLQTSFYRLDAAGIGDQFRWLTAARLVLGVGPPRHADTAGIRLAERRLDVLQRGDLVDSQGPSRGHIRVRRGRHRGVGRVHPSDESAEATTGFEDAGRFQLAVCAGYRVDRQPQLAGEFPHRRQPSARRQPAVADTVDDLRPELVEKGTGSTRVNAHPIPQLGHVLSIA